MTHAEKRFLLELEVLRTFCYGNPEGFIDVRVLIARAGVWHPDSVIARRVIMQLTEQGYLLPVQSDRPRVRVWATGAKLLLSHILRRHMDNNTSIRLLSRLWVALGENELLAEDAAQYARARELLSLLPENVKEYIHDNPL